MNKVKDQCWWEHWCHGYVPVWLCVPPPVHQFVDLDWVAVGAWSFAFTLVVFLRKCEDWLSKFSFMYVWVPYRKVVSVMLRYVCCFCSAWLVYLTYIYVYDRVLGFSSRVLSLLFPPHLPCISLINPALLLVSSSANQLPACPHVLPPVPCCFIIFSLYLSPGFQLSHVGAFVL